MSRFLPAVRATSHAVAERQKATRLLKKHRKRLESTSPEDPSYEESTQAVHQAEVDLKYTLNFPLMMKYQSLYAKPGAPEPDGEAGPARKPEMWHHIERAIAEGTLDEVRNMKVKPTARPSQSVKASVSRASTSRGEPVEQSEKRPLDQKALNDRPPRESHMDSPPLNEGSDDGGFFEE